MRDITKCLTQVVSLLVEYRDDVKIERQELRASDVISVKVNMSDHGRVIGEGGRTVRFLQSLVETYAAIHGERMRLVVLDPETGRNEGIKRFETNPDWDPQPATKIFEELLNHYVAADVTCTDLGGKNLVFEVEISDDDDAIAKEDFRKEFGFLMEAVCKANGRVCAVDIYDG